MLLFHLSVITIESDKSSVEIPSTIAGKVEKVEVKVGDKVSRGDMILNIVPSKQNKKENPIPKDTESIIKQAEAALAVKKDEAEVTQQSIQKKEQSTIQATPGQAATRAVVRRTCSTRRRLPSAPSVPEPR